MQATIQRTSYCRQHPDFQPAILAQLSKVDTALQIIGKLRAEYESVLACFAKDSPTQEDLRSALLGVKRIQALGRPIHDLGMVNTDLSMMLEDILCGDIWKAIPIMEESFWESIPECVEPVSIFSGLGEDPFDEE
jgi:hypothetical protein